MSTRAYQFGKVKKDISSSPNCFIVDGKSWWNQWKHFLTVRVNPALQLKKQILSHLFLAKLKAIDIPTKPKVTSETL